MTLSAIGVEDGIHCWHRDAARDESRCCRCPATRPEPKNEITVEAR